MNWIANTVIKAYQEKERPLFRALQHEQFIRDGLEGWPLLQWYSCISFVYKNSFTKCFHRGKGRNYSSHGVSSSWFCMLCIDERRAKHISVFVIFPDRQLLLLEWDSHRPETSQRVEWADFTNVNSLKSSPCIANETRWRSTK